MPKYAVSAREEGASISLTARVVGERLRLSVEDTGPGAAAQRELFDAPGAPVSGAIAERDGALVGYALWHFAYETAWAARAHKLPSFRGNKIQHRFFCILFLSMKKMKNTS